MNTVHIFGNLGADPELRVAASGTAVLKLRVATKERVKKGDEWVEHTEWHSVTTFGKRAEGLAKFLSKGSKVLVAGKLRTTSYEKDGVKRYTTEIVADDIELGGGKRDQASDEPAAKSTDEFSLPDDAELPF